MASYAYFYEAGGWNQNSRFALVRAILERGTLQIDAYQLHTGDRALHNGHYYSDKAPGASLLAVPPVALARVVARVVGTDPESFPGIAWTSYVATVATSGLFTAVAALLIMWTAIKWGYSTNAGTFAALAYGLATPAWAYATLFMGHGQTAGCLMIAFAATLAIEGRRGLDASGPAWLIGISGGWAVVTEFPAAIPAVLIGLLALDRVRDGGLKVLVAVRIGAGVIVAAIPLLVYNVLAFGSPFHLGYASEEGFHELQQGFFGITYPKLSVVVQLLMGSYRGLLPLAPVVLLAAVGLVLLARSPRTMRPALVAAGISAYYLLLNASYYYWEGGWAYGPRQFTAALPFVCLGLPAMWDRRQRFERALLLTAFAWGVAVTLVAVSTTPQPPSNLRSPVTQFLWPAFLDGDLSLNHQTFVHHSANPDMLRGHKVPHAAWNLGEVAGISGLPSLLPLMAVWIIGVGLWRVSRE